jgi:spore coat polysaccharide biosynthesis protein SpsF
LGNKIVASIEARMTSRRLPGKVLMESIDGISMLEFMIKRVQNSKKIDEIIVATTTNNTDDPIVELCEKLNISFFRGSESDVLLRVYEAHKYLKSSLVVELTGDCPLIDPKIIDNCIEIYLNNNFDYVSNVHVRSFPDGFDTQVFSYDLLDKVNRLAKSKFDRENVTPYIYKNNKENSFKLKAVIAEDANFWPDLRVTLDDTGDYKLLKTIIKELYPTIGINFSCKNIIDYLKRNKHLLDLLKDVRKTSNPYQKTINKIEKNL